MMPDHEGDAFPKFAEIRIAILGHGQVYIFMYAKELEILQIRTAPAMAVKLDRLRVGGWFSSFPCPAPFLFAAVTQALDRLHDFGCRRGSVLAMPPRVLPAYGVRGCLSEGRAFVISSPAFSIHPSAWWSPIETRWAPTTWRKATSEPLYAQNPCPGTGDGSSSPQLPGSALAWSPLGGLS